MGNKSKKYRRPISTNSVSNAAVNTAAAENKPLSTTSIKQGSVEATITTHNFTRDLMWTGIVTAIIVVLIIVALIVIPH